MQSTVGELVMEFVGRFKVSTVRAAEKIPIVESRSDGNLSGIIANYAGTISYRGKKKRERKREREREEKIMYKDVTLKN